MSDETNDRGEIVSTRNSYEEGWWCPYDWACGCGVQVKAGQYHVHVYGDDGELTVENKAGLCP